MFDTIGSSIPLIRDGRLRALAVTTAQRLAVLPAVPTVAEAGMPGYAANFWYGLAVSTAVPAGLQERLHAAFAEVLAQPAFHRFLEPLGLSPEPARGIAAIAAHVAEERRLWTQVLRDRGVALD